MCCIRIDYAMLESYSRGALVILATTCSIICRKFPLYTQWAVMTLKNICMVIKSLYI